MDDSLREAEGSVENEVAFMIKSHPSEDLGVKAPWQTWRAATRDPVEVLRYE